MKNVFNVKIRTTLWIMNNYGTSTSFEPWKVMDILVDWSYYVDFNFARKH